MLKHHRFVTNDWTTVFRKPMITSTPSAINQIPEIYQSHPSRPLPSSISNTSDPTHQVPPHIGVVVAFLSPLSADDAEKIRQLQEVRERWDQAYGRWLPHVTLIPPFTIPAGPERDHEAVPVSIRSARGKEEANGFQDMPRATQTQSTILNNQQPLRQSRNPAAQQESISISQLRQSLDKISTTLSRICSDFPVHTLKLDDIGTFKLREYTNVHLRPSFDHTSEPNGGAGGELEIVKLQKALTEAFAREALVGGKRIAGPIRVPMENRAARRQRERTASTNDTPVPTLHTSINGFPAQDSGEGTGRTYSRPHYRFGGIDEARCVTLLTVEIEHETRRDDAAVVTDSETRGEVMNEARHLVPDQNTGDASGTNEKPASPNVPSHATSQSYRDTQRPTKTNERQKFKPHASVGQARGPRECGKLITVAKAVLKGDPGHSSTAGRDVPQGIDCWIDKVYLLTKPVGKGGPYELYSVAHLRGADGKDS